MMAEGVDQVIAAAVLDTLNGYRGDNIWQDVIYHLLTAEEWEAAPDSMDRFVRQGVTFRYEPSVAKWVTNA